MVTRLELIAGAAGKLPRQWVIALMREQKLSPVLRLPAKKRAVLPKDAADLLQSLDILEKVKNMSPDPWQSPAQFALHLDCLTSASSMLRATPNPFDELLSETDVADSCKNLLRGLAATCQADLESLRKAKNDELFEKYSAVFVCLDSWDFGSCKEFFDGSDKQDKNVQQLLASPLPAVSGKRPQWSW